MDITLAEIVSLSASSDEEKIKELYKRVEEVSIQLRKKLSTNIVAADTYLTFNKGHLEISIGDVFLKGSEVKYIRHFSKKMKACIWQEKCKAYKSGRDCEYYHPAVNDHRILPHNPAPIMKDFLECPLESLGAFYKIYPSVRPEVADLKLRILDGIIRLLWLSSEGIKI